MSIITNLERLKMAIEGINIPDEKLLVYLQENGFNVNDPLTGDAYDSSSKADLKKIYKTALSILEDIANNPQNMKNYRTEDMSISNFAENIQNRIDQLEKKIRQIPDENMVSINESGSSFIYMFDY